MKTGLVIGAFALQAFALNFDNARTLLQTVTNDQFGFSAPMVHDLDKDGDLELMLGVMKDGDFQGYVYTFENSGTTLEPQYMLPNNGGYTKDILTVDGSILKLVGST